jgi:hypothetical protein
MDPAIAPVHAVLLRNGKVFCYPDETVKNYQLFDPATNTVGPKTGQNVSSDFFCGAHVSLFDGTVLLIGGLGNGASTYDLTAVRDPICDCPPFCPPIPYENCFPPAFTPTTPPFVPNRYYPTSTVLASGRILVVGHSLRDDASLTPEVYDHPASSWLQLTGAKVCHPDNPTPTCPNSTGLATYYVPFYSFLYQLSSGKVLYCGGSEEEARRHRVYTRTLDVSGVGQWQTLSPSLADPISGRSAVMYDKDRIIKAGGVDQSTGPEPETNAVYRINMRASAPSWLALSPLQHHSGGVDNPGTGTQNGSFYLLTLADQKILALGGIGGAEIPEMLDAADSTNSWVSMNQTSAMRGYHATTLLLPDGSVFFGSGRNPYDPVHPNEERTDIQIFYPPYLYKAGDVRVELVDRPQVLSGAPTLLGTGSTFTVSVSAGDGTAIAKASLIRPGAVTHYDDQDARYVPLKSSGTTGPWSPGSITFTAPLSAEEAPPGYYMLFLVNDLTHPSVATFVQVWGVVQSSVKETISVSCTAPITFDVSFATSIASSPASPDTVRIYPPTGGVIVRTASPLADARQHRIIANNINCVPPGTWTYVVSSTLNNAVTRSISKSVQITCPSCPPPCHPPCEFE